MFQPSPAVRIFLYCGVADIRKSFDGLSAIVTESVGKNLLSGAYFVVFNRNRNRCKSTLQAINHYNGPQVVRPSMICLTNPMKFTLRCSTK